MGSFCFDDWGRIAYAEALVKQTAAFETALKNKQEGIPVANRLIFCEHEPVLTIGKHGKDANLLVSQPLLEQRGVGLFHVGRGGDITYHGPGQITGYPVFDLESFGMGLKQYVATLEEAVIRFLALYGIRGERLPGAAGVWLDTQLPGKARKICAIGVKSSRFVTMHGFALNINTDLDYFSLINPCGFTDKGVTSLARELGAQQDFEKAKSRLLAVFAELFR